MNHSDPQGDGYDENNRGKVTRPLWTPGRTGESRSDWRPFGQTNVLNHPEHLEDCKQEPDKKEDAAN